MQGKCAGIFLSLLILMVMKVDSKFQRPKDWNVYDTELWHRMKSAVNNNEAYRSPKSTGPVQLSSNSFNTWIGNFLCTWLLDCEIKNSTEENSSTRNLKFAQPAQPLRQPPLRPPPIPPLRPPPLRPEPKPKPKPEPEPEPKPKLVRINCPKIPTDYSRFECSPNAYKFHMEQLSWPSAQSRCQRESAQLAVIENEVQYGIVKKLAKLEMGDTAIRFHVGSGRRSIENTLKTIYGTFEKLGPHRPKTYTSGTHCTGFVIIPNRFHGINDGPCNLRRSFMCEIKVPYNCT